jgi:hypothetical protein
MGSTGCTETSLNKHQPALRKNPEERRPQLNRGGNDVEKKQALPN